MDEQIWAPNFTAREFSNEYSKSSNEKRVKFNQTSRRPSNPSTPLASSQKRPQKEKRAGKRVNFSNENPRNSFNHPSFNAQRNPVTFSAKSPLNKAQSYMPMYSYMPNVPASMSPGQHPFFGMPMHGYLAPATASVESAISSRQSATSEQSSDTAAGDSPNATTKSTTPPIIKKRQHSIHCQYIIKTFGACQQKRVFFTI